MNQLALHDMPTLADCLRAATRGPAGCTRCVWCGSTDVFRRAADEWPPATAVLCRSCGAELTVDRRLARVG